MKTFIATAAFASFLAMVISSSRASSTAALRSLQEKQQKQPGQRNLATAEELAKEIAVELASDIPVLGSFAAAVVEILWDTGSDQYLYDYVQELIDAAIFQENKEELQNNIKSLQDTIEMAASLDWEESGFTKYSYLLDAQTYGNDVSMGLRWTESELDDEDDLKENMQLIALTALFAPIHLSVLKDLYMYSAYYYPDGVSSDTLDLFESELQEYATLYEDYFLYVQSTWYDWRYEQFDTYYDTVKLICFGSWGFVDDLGEVADQWHPNSCTNTCSGLGSCLRGKIEDELTDNIMPGLYESFKATIDSVLNIQADATNYPPIFCNPDQIYARDSSDDDWECVDKSTCLIDDVDGNCDNGETCLEWEDCDSGYCNSNNYCASLSKRRRLEAMPGYVLSDSDWENYKATCSELDYKLSIAVDSHMQFLAEPIDGGVISISCPSVLFHRGSTNKEVLQLDTNLSNAQSWGIATVGVYNLQELAEAHDAVKVSTNYDVVLDNCGDYIERYAIQLGLQTTPEIANWVATQLVQHTSGELVANILSNKNKEHYGITDNMSDVEIVLRVVEGRAKKLYGKK